MSRSGAANGAVRFCAIAALAAGLGGCAWITSWFSKGPKAPPPVAVIQEAPQSDVESRPASAAHAACPNYTQAVQNAPFPRAAIIRGVDQGSASVGFLVDGTTVTVLSVTSSDPAFGNAASDIVRTLACRVDQPTRFEVPFSWRTSR